MGGIIGFEGAAPVGRVVVADIEYVNDIFILGVGIDAGIIPGPLAKGAVAVDPLPGVTAVITPENTAFIGFDDCPYPVANDG